jgi:hypothetical protein
VLSPAPSTQLDLLGDRTSNQSQALSVGEEMSTHGDGDDQGGTTPHVPWCVEGLQNPCRPQQWPAAFFNPVVGRGLDVALMQWRPTTSLQLWELWEQCPAWLHSSLCGTSRALVGTRRPVARPTSRRLFYDA